MFLNTSIKVLTIFLTILALNPIRIYACGNTETKSSRSKTCKENATEKCCSSNENGSCGNKCDGKCDGKCKHTGCHCSSNKHFFGIQSIFANFTICNDTDFSIEKNMHYQAIFCSNLYAFVWLPPKIS